MAHAYASIIVHLFFSTKKRRPFLHAGIRPRLFTTMADIAKSQHAWVYAIGGVEDHVHLLLSLPRTKTLATLVEKIKSESSKWVKLTDPTLEEFSWQAGYAAFSVSESLLKNVTDYVKYQESVHKSRETQKEYQRFLECNHLVIEEKEEDTFFD